MKRYQELLASWDARKGPCSSEMFSMQARQRIATLFLELPGTNGDQGLNGEQQISLAECSTELAELGAEDGLSEHVFRTELRDCEMALFAMLISRATDKSSQQVPAGCSDELRYIAGLFSSLDDVIAQSVQKFAEKKESSVVHTNSSGTSGKKQKTLQHEIRTPLQGALLTTELMLEDAGHGDPVSADDILAVRKSIETAVGILNDFAARSTPE